MSPDAAYELIKICISEGFMIVTPMVLTALVVGVLVGLLQSITSIQEQSLTFVPKLVAAGAVLWLTAPWMLEKMTFLVFSFFQRAGDVLK